MKKILGIYIGLFILSSCDNKICNDPEGNERYIVQVDSAQYEIKKIRFSGNSIYILVPKNSNVTPNKALASLILINLSIFLEIYIKMYKFV